MLMLDLVLVGLAISLEPVPLTSFILVLASKGGVRKGAGFVGGWILSLLAIVIITLLATGNSPPKPSTAPSLAALATKIAIGLSLLVVAFIQRRRMGKRQRPKRTPRWQTSIDDMSALYASGLGVFVQPWVLIAAGVATIVQAKLSSWADYLALAFFVLLAAGTYLCIEVFAAARPETAGEFLFRLRSWLDNHTDEIIIWVSAILGIWLIGHSTYLIVS